MALPANDDDNGGQFTMHQVVNTHVRGHDLSVVYTNELVSVESSIQTMEQLLAEDKYQVVGFDLEFTSSHARQDQKVKGSTNNKQNCLVELASAIIDPYYMKMKDKSKKDKNVWHNACDQILDEEHVNYAAKDAYTSYEIYRWLIDMRKYLCPAPDEGSSHKAVAGASQEVDD
ncbi:putative methyltransferase PMT27 [Hordeum vulgare]|nr:putative methyltransferase PMT27 [Hordeum vulgare]